SQIASAFRRPQPLGDRGVARPYARIDVFGVHVFGPDARFPAQNQLLLFRRERGGWSAKRVHRIMPRSTPSEVKVVAVRENAAISILRSGGKRIHATP